MQDNTISILIQAKDNASKTLETVGKEVQNTGKNVDNVSGSWVKMGTIIGAVSGLVQSAVYTAASGVESIVSDAIKRVDTLDNSAKVFANLGFKSDDTKVAMDALDKSIRGLPTSLDQAVGGMESLALQNGNIKDAQEEFSAMNDAVLSSGGSTAQLQNAIQQVTQLDMKGPIDAQTWDSLRQSGLEPAMKTMADMSGVSLADLKTSFGNGSLTVQDFMNKLITMDTTGSGHVASLQKQAKDMTDGIGTGFANMKTAATRDMGKVLEAVGDKRISDALKNIGGLFDDVGKHAKGLVQVASWLVPIAGAVLLVAVAIKIATAAQALWNAVMDLDPWLVIATVVIAVIFEIITHWKQVTDVVKQGWSDIKQWGSDAWQAIQRVWDPVAQFFADIWRDIKNGASSVLSFFKTVFGDIYRVAIKPPLDLVMAYFRISLAVYTYVFDVMRGLAIVTWNFIYGTVIKPNIDLIVAAMQLVATVATAVWDVIKVAAAAAWSFIWSYIIKPNLDAITAAAGAVGTAVSAVWSFIYSTATSIWGAIVSYVDGVWQHFTDGAGKGASAISNAFSAVAGGIKNVFKDALNWVIDRLDDLIKAVNNTAGRLPGVPKLGLIPELAFGLGTSFAPGGLAMVGEHGPEQVILPRGTQVVPNYKLGRQSHTGGVTLYQTNNIFNQADMTAANRELGYRLAHA